MFIGTFCIRKKRVISHPKIKTHSHIHIHTHRYIQEGFNGFLRTTWTASPQFGEFRIRFDFNNELFPNKTILFKIKHYIIVLRVFFWSGIDVVVYAARKSSSIILLVK